MNETVGIIGGGQLGLMLSEAARSVNLEPIVLDPTINCPASHIAKQLVGDYKKTAPIIRFAKNSQNITFEIEGTNVNALEIIKKMGTNVNPEPESLRIIQDKLAQKQFLLSNEIPTPKFTDVKNEKDIKKAATYLGYPLILKSRFHGFDGRGNALIKNKDQINSALKKLNTKQLYIEEYIHFEREIAMQIVRSKNNKLLLYPLVKTIQSNNICQIVLYPSGLNKNTEQKAITIARNCISKLYGSGVFAVEMFYTKNGKILVNEIAPRVHNSGHWTIEGCVTSQFENHIRAISGIPLKSTEPKVKSAVMINILGNRNGLAKIQGLKKVKRLRNVYLHFYNKIETRKERKMGHITVTGDDQNKVLKKAISARKMIKI